MPFERRLPSGVRRARRCAAASYYKVFSRTTCMRTVSRLAIGLNSTDLASTKCSMGRVVWNQNIAMCELV
jgi:hypothetical protein